MAIEFERITPAMAQSWLNRNKGNRKLRDGVVEKYAEDMRQGRWTRCAMPISFYVDGEVADGQHRLWAIVESGVPQEFLVLRDLAREDGLNIDTGLSRTIVDAGRISGIDKNLSVELVATARAITMGGPHADSKRSSNAAKLEMVAAHRAAAEWAIHNGPRGKNLRNAVTLAAIGRAWYHHQDDLDTLKRFCDVMSSGLPDAPGEFAAVALRNYMLQKANIATTTAMWVDTFRKAQAAIRSFMDARSLKVIKTQSTEAYPLKSASQLAKMAKRK